MTIKTGCTVKVPCIEEFTFTADEIVAGRGKAYTPYEHPDLLRALRALSDYHHWVESRLMPIACKWMEEHKSEFQSSLTPDQQDDIGASVEAAYAVVAKTQWWMDIVAQSSTPGYRDQLLRTTKPNPIWQKETAEFFKAEEAIKSSR